ncbi:MAG: DUF192 domain-containing protein [Synechococcales cyanobacterium CRU_2_2]|nr:DUF192 domain-containing protein [Synechococcales cyanobacterium CRU_2_2]
MFYGKVRAMGSAVFVAIALSLASLLLMGCTTSTAESPAGGPAPEQSAPEQSEPGQSVFTQPQILPVGGTVQLGDKVIELEVTRTPEEQAMGLMFREKLPDHRGMLFRFDPPRTARFWMKNVVINLDMVFLHQGKIVEIVAQVPPCDRNPCPTYGPMDQLVDSVIELRGGLAAELGLKPGDAVSIALKQP